MEKNVGRAAIKKKKRSRVCETNRSMLLEQIHKFSRAENKLKCMCACGECKKRFYTLTVKRSNFYVLSLI